ncbi:hypothetical protein ONZ45_g10472 [Pleurotus djamor]|nr:hypothetical protein ONZ45_g10472 [Pleurotus djamor]
MDSILCGLCYGPPIKPTSIPCGHVYCADCWCAYERRRGIRGGYEHGRSLRREFKVLLCVMCRGLVEAGITDRHGPRSPHATRHIPTPQHLPPLRTSTPSAELLLSRTSGRRFKSKSNFDIDRLLAHLSAQETLLNSELTILQRTQKYLKRIIERRSPEKEPSLEFGLVFALTVILLGFAAFIVIWIIDVTPVLLSLYLSASGSTFTFFKSFVVQARHPPPPTPTIPASLPTSITNKLSLAYLKRLLTFFHPTNLKEVRLYIGFYNGDLPFCLVLVELRSPSDCVCLFHSRGARSEALQIKTLIMASWIYSTTGNDQGQPVYIASELDFKGGVHPCKVAPHLWPDHCRVSYGGAEVPHKGNYDLLPFSTELMEFVDTTGGKIPDGRRVVLGGYEDGKPLYHALVEVEDGVWVPGKAALHLGDQGGGDAPYGDKENYRFEHKILCWR